MKAFYSPRSPSTFLRCAKDYQLVRWPCFVPRASLATISNFKPPAVQNEPNQHYAKGSSHRQGLEAALHAIKKRIPIQIPAVVAGEAIYEQATSAQLDPSDHVTVLAQYSTVTDQDVSKAIEAALGAKSEWENMPFVDRAAIVLKAADLLGSKYRYDMMAATMLGQGKNAWQAEIDAAAELCDFLRFNVAYAQELYSQQPVHNAQAVWNRVEYRALEGFIYAISPFNFTAIGGNLPAAPALMGNVVVWKPSPSAMASNHLVYKILLEAGLPPNVIQFVPGDAERVTGVVLSHPHLGGLHFTGSTSVFRSLYGKIGQGIANSVYKAYPRVVAETGGKNFHLIHKSADSKNAVMQTIRGAFEYQGQKCSATSRAYVPASIWKDFKTEIAAEAQKLKVGPPSEFGNFVGPVIHERSFTKLKTVIDKAKNDKELELIAGGTYDQSKGYFVHPTIYKSDTPHHPILSTELFGPILTIYVYDDSTPDSWEQACNLVDSTSDYGLTGAIFATDRAVIRYAESALRNAAGNFYINCKSTGAVVGQQPFGGGRASGTNDKAGSINLLSRFVSVRSIKEEFLPLSSVEYPSNET